MTTSPREDLLLLLGELKTVALERERLVARETVLRAKIHAATAPSMPAPVASGPPPPAPEAPDKRRRGASKRMLALLHERPDADVGWLTTNAYGSDTARNRRRTRSILSYLRYRGQLSDQPRRAFSNEA